MRSTTCSCRSSQARASLGSLGASQQGLAAAAPGQRRGSAEGAAVGTLSSAGLGLPEQNATSSLSRPGSAAQPAGPSRRLSGAGPLPSGPGMGLQPSSPPMTAPAGLGPLRSRPSSRSRSSGSGGAAPDHALPSSLSSALLPAADGSPRSPLLLRPGSGRAAGAALAPLGSASFGGGGSAGSPAPSGLPPTAPAAGPALSRQLSAAPLPSRPSAPSPTPPSPPPPQQQRQQQPAVQASRQDAAAMERRVEEDLLLLRSRLQCVLDPASSSTLDQVRVRCWCACPAPRVCLRVLR